jgi:hypothetical protein
MAIGRLRRAASRYLKSKQKKKPCHANRAPGMWWLSSQPPAWIALAGNSQTTAQQPANEIYNGRP